VQIGLSATRRQQRDPIRASRTKLRIPAYFTRTVPKYEPFRGSSCLWAQGLSHEFGSGRTRVEGLGSGRRSRRPPILKRFASESAKRTAGNEMALDVKRVLDCGMNRQEPLG
jgi:hypothetical protein